MKWSLNAGSIFGIKLRIHITFFLLPLFVFASNRSEGLRHAFLSVFFVCAIFACVIIHELAHSLVARLFGREPKSITLLPIGGVAAIDRMPTNPAQEIAISIVGPATNILIAILLAIIGGQTLLAALQNANLTTSQAFITNLIAANIVLAVFNLIPALPMDGGRVLRSLLAMKFDYLRATLWAAAVGKVIAIIFVVLGFFYDPWLALIGFFIYSGANSERQQAIMQAQFVMTPPGEATTPNFANPEQDEETIRRQSDGF